jgi:hypothetical protein
VEHERHTFANLISIAAAGAVGEKKVEEGDATGKTGGGHEFVSSGRRSNEIGAGHPVASLCG